MKYRWRKLQCTISKSTINHHIDHHQLGAIEDFDHRERYSTLTFPNLSFISMTLEFDSCVILPGEIRCLPLLRVKRLTHNKGSKLRSFHFEGN